MKIFYFKSPGLKLVLESKDRLVIVSSAIKMSVSNFMFLVFMSHQLVLNGNVFFHSNMYVTFLSFFNLISFFFRICFSSWA